MNGQIKYDDFFEWWGAGLPVEQRTRDLWVNKCRLRVVEFNPSPVPVYRWVVVATDLGQGHGITIRNSADNLVPLVAEKFNLNLKRMIWIEHYPVHPDYPYKEAMELVWMEPFKMNSGRMSLKAKRRDATLDILKMIVPYVPEAKVMVKNIEGRGKTILG